MELRLEYAGFWARLLAMVLDIIVLYGLLKIMGLIVSGWMSHFITICLFLMVITLYFVVLTCLYGQTLGKMVIGIKVKRDREGMENGERDRAITWDEALFRELIGRTLSGLCLFIGFIMISFQPKRQALHDHLSRFIVVWDSDDISEGDLK